MDFVGFGALNLDRLYKVESIAKGDEEIPIKETVEQPGGSAANTIYALGKLGLSAGFFGAVGSDGEGEKVLSSLKEVGVDTSQIKIKDNMRTGLVIGLVDPKGERALYIAPGANNVITSEDLDLDYLKQTKILHMTSFVGENQLELQKKVVEGLYDLIRLSFAPGSLYAKKGLSAISPIIKRSHVLFLNEAETKILTGMEYESASKFLIKMGCSIVVITLKERGCYVSSGTESEHVPAQKTDVKDTTGAGDAFCAGFLYGLSQDKELKHCAIIGNYLASRCISEIGARKGLPSRDELVAKLVDIF
ncbi:MAG: carbohydrate kinase family protein [Thermoplasmata archaeon]|nr:MAG: carbohydrate kinase family protein [Thermoplasmata archaeon]